MGCFFFSSRRRHTRCSRDWSSDVCSSDLHRAVQTDFRPWAGFLSPTSYSGQLCLPASPNEGESESSSLADNPSTLGVLLDHVQQLFNRIAQADARTLTTRLKRQKILGADVSYLSHSTVDGIVAEVAN